MAQRGSTAIHVGGASRVPSEPTQVAQPVSSVAVLEQELDALRAAVTTLTTDKPWEEFPGRTYEHIQALPEAVWEIEHPLTGRKPSVTVVDSAGSWVIGEVKYEGTKVVITFGAAFSGKAYLN